MTGSSPETRRMIAMTSRASASRRSLVTVARSSSTGTAVTWVLTLLLEEVAMPPSLRVARELGQC